jgi:polysaccharide export outer membrane protein
MTPNRSLTVPNGQSGLLKSLLLLAVSLAGTGLAHAQFSGPAPGVSSSANQVTTPTTDLAILNPQQRDLVLAPGDLMTIRLFGSPEYSPIVRVAIDGTIQLPLIGTVPVAGLTVDHASTLIAERLQDARMYKDPQVSIQVTEAVTQFATVSGEMHGIVPLSGSRRLLDVLASVGSLPVTASHVITVLRPSVPQPIVVDLGSDPTRVAQNDIPILPGDTILISRVGVVYFVGAFHTQGAIPLQQTSPLTLMQATALVGGVGYEGEFKDTRIIRTTGLERKEVKVNIKHILDGTDPDPVLQADDIVFLPSNALKAAIKSGGIGVVTSIASLLIIASQNR